MLENLAKYNIILASNSPRRKELLAGLGVNYSIKIMPDIDESYPAHLQGADIPTYIARQKAAAYVATMQPNDLIITADTIVWINGKVLGKPADRDEAIQMLQQLSGQTHYVYTGVCLTTANGQRNFSTATKVTFAQLSLSEITYYVDHFSPLDKAGSYGVQEWIGYIGVVSISGSYFNVMGLPVQRLYQELKKL